MPKIDTYKPLRIYPPLSPSQADNNNSVQKDHHIAPVFPISGYIMYSVPAEHDILCITDVGVYVRWVVKMCTLISHGAEMIKSIFNFGHQLIKTCTFWYLYRGAFYSLHNVPRTCFLFRLFTRTYILLYRSQKSLFAQNKKH